MLQVFLSPHAFSPKPRHISVLMDKQIGKGAQVTHASSLLANSRMQEVRLADFTYSEIYELLLYNRNSERRTVDCLNVFLYL